MQPGCAGLRQSDPGLKEGMMTDSKEHNKHKHSKPEPTPEEKASQPEGSQAPGQNDGAAPEGTPAPEGGAAPEAAQEPLVGLTLEEFNALQSKADEAEKKAR